MFYHEVIKAGLVYVEKNDMAYIQYTCDEQDAIDAFEEYTGTKINNETMHFKKTVGRSCPTSSCFLCGTNGSIFFVKDEQLLRSNARARL